MNLDEFRRLTDRLSPRLERGMDLPTMAEALGKVPAEHGQRGIRNVLQDEAIAAISSGHAAGWRLCREMANDLVFEHVADGADLSPYLPMLESIRDWCRGEEDGQPLVADWATIVQAARDAHAIAREDLQVPRLTAYSSTIWRANASKRFHGIGQKGRGAPVAKVLTPERHDAIVQHIEKLAVRIGGVEIAKRLFAELTPYFHPVQRRYHFVNRFPTWAGATEARVPANYLLQLAAKFPIAAKPHDASRKAWMDLRQACIDYAALHEVQPTSQLWTMGVSPHAHSKFIRELALHDTLFTLQQQRPSDLILIGRDLLDGLSQNGKITAAALTEARAGLAVTSAVLGIGHDLRGPQTLTTNGIAECASSLSIETVRDLMARFFAHPLAQGKPGANRRFRHPTDVPIGRHGSGVRTGSDFPTRPLLATGSDKYLLLDGAACSVSFFEAFLAILRQTVSETHVGTAVETVILRALARAGLEPKFGRYSTPDGDSDCDAVIECDDGIIFFEAKKKALTGTARAGLDLDLLVDVAKSLVKASIQTGLQEYRLREYGKLDLVQGDGRIVELPWRGRKVMRIAVSLPDYGAFQDNTVAKILLSHHGVSTFSLIAEVASDPVFVDRLAAINLQAEDLKAVNTKLYDQAGKPAEWDPYVNCWFMSVPQLLVLLDGIKSTSDLWRRLSFYRGMVRGSRDFYYELHLQLAMGAP